MRQVRPPKLRSIAASVLAAGLVACSPPPSPTGPSLSAAAAREIGFGTVADAHAALAARGDLRHFVRGTYEVFVDDPARAVWLFTLPDSAAYPALVRRELVDSQAGVVMRSSVFCEAPQTICRLLQENTRLMDAVLVETLGHGDVPRNVAVPPPAGVRL